MRSTGKLEIAIMTIISIVVSCGTADAQRRHFHPYRIAAVAARQDATVHISNHFTQEERFKMAIAYLENHEYLTVNRYAKMTQLPKAAAKAELDAFAADKDKPIANAIKGKKNVYILLRK